MTPAGQTASTVQSKVNKSSFNIIMNKYTVLPLSFFTCITLSFRSAFSAVIWNELFALHCSLLWCILMCFLSGEYTCKLAICITPVQLPNWSRSLLNKLMNKNKTTMQHMFLTQRVCGGESKALSSLFRNYSVCLEPYYRCTAHLYVGQFEETAPFLLEKFRGFLEII